MHICINVSFRLKITIENTSLLVDDMKWEIKFFGILCRTAARVGDRKLTSVKNGCSLQYFYYKYNFFNKNGLSEWYKRFAGTEMSDICDQCFCSIKVILQKL